MFDELNRLYLEIFKNILVYFEIYTFAVKSAFLYFGTWFVTRALLLTRIKSPETYCFD